MKISLNKIRYAGEHYGTPDLVPDGIEKLVQKIGAQLGAVEDVVDYGSKFDGIIIAKVISCEPHPNADKLIVCKIDDGGVVKEVERDETGYVQVVSRAINERGEVNIQANTMVGWIPPGKIVPRTHGADQFVLEAREMRGVVSHGMLASGYELAINDDHSGVMALDTDAKPGTSFAEAYRAEGEMIIDIENKMFTHRPDCFGIMGVTREIAGIQHKPFKSPDWYTPNPKFPQVEAEQLSLTVTNELPELVPRFTAITMSDITVKPSPVWLQVVLSEVGIRPINNIVDYTNFWMLETGQPLHAYDYDKVKALSGGGATIVVRNPKPDEKITLLNGKEVKPRPETIMIATDKQAIGIGGVMGGSETEVDKNTKNIILECANFDMYSIRRTSMAHGLFTDAVTRFTKGQSPLQNLAVLAKIVESIKDDAGGKVASEVIDDNQVDEVVLKRSSLYLPVKLSRGFINDRLGLELSLKEMKQLLENVEFQVDIEGDELTVAAPFWRTDIELREDVVEEIGRLYGYDHLPLALPKRDLTPAPRDPLLELKANIRGSLSRAGANEVLTYSFVHGDLLEKVGQDRSAAFQISNALSPDLQYYRLSLTPSLLEKVHPNIKAGYGEFALFELGKAHVLGKEKDGLPVEFDRVALVIAGKKKPAGASYYQARKYLMALLESLQLNHEVRFQSLGTDDQDSAASYYEPGRAATIYLGDKVIGRIGEYKASVRRALKLPPACAGFELGIIPLTSEASTKQYVPLPRFPKVRQDVTLKVPARLSYQELFDFLQAQVEASRPEYVLTTLNPLDIFQRDDDQEHKQMTFRLEIASYERTLTDQEVNKLLEVVSSAAKEAFEAERV